jgi:ABC-type sugar transport system substrate-binding protein
MERHSRHGILVAIGVTVAALCAACGSSGTTSSPGAGSSAGASSSPSAVNVSAAKSELAQYLKVPAHIAQTVALPKAPPKGKTLIYLNQSSVPTTTAIGDAAEAAAHAAGWNFSEISYDPANPASLVSAFATALLKHPTVVGVTGIDPSDYASTLANYRKAGVPIVVTSGVPAPITKTVIGLVDDSRADEAAALASWLASDSGGTGHALLAHVTGFPSLDAIVASFKADIKTLCPHCVINEVDVPVSEAEQGQEDGLVVSALRSNQGDKYLIFDDGDFATGINSALSAASISGIKIAGFNMQPSEASALRSGTQAAWTADNNSVTGYDIVDIALRYAEGVAITTNDQTEPTQLITPSNVGSISTWNEPPNALQQYEKLWKVPLKS